MAPPTPTTTPIIVFRVLADIPELPLPLLSDWDRAAVGVVTDVEVELVTEPSEAVTTTMAVEVTGSALVVEEVSDDAVLEPDSVDDAPAEELVGDGAFSLVTVLDVGAGLSDEVGVDAEAGVDVVSEDEVLVVVAGTDVDVLVTSVAEEVVESAAAVVVAATVLPLPLTSAASSEPRLATRALLYRPRIAASMMKAWVTEEADSAATSSFSILVECMM